MVIYPTRPRPARPRAAFHIPSHNSARPAPLSIPSDPLLFAADSLGFHPDPVQAHVLSSDSKRLILCCSRQWGKSTLAAIKALHFALTNPATTTLIAAPSLRQSISFLKLAIGLLAPLNIAHKPDRFVAHSLLLPNRARIVAIPGIQKTIRGPSPSLIVIDEAAWLLDETYFAIRPMLAATNGSLFLLSTPFGEYGFFYDAWHDKSETWTRVQATASECPRITQSFLDEERRTMTAERFKREYMCEFTPGEAQFFERALIERAFRDDVETWDLGDIVCSR